MIRTVRNRRNRRATWPLFLVGAGIVALLAIGSFLLRQGALSPNSAPVADPDQITTDVLIFRPALTETVRDGQCTAHSVLIPRTDVWRCTVGAQEYDPCFAVFAAPDAAGNIPDANVRVICGADPLTGAAGFRVNQAKPLPIAKRNADAKTIDASDLMSLEYQLDLLPRPIRLLRGQSYVRDDAILAGGVVVGLSGMKASGDLNADGVDDMATLLVADAGAEGMFIYLNAIANQGGRPVNVASTALGDRIKVDKLDIRDGQIVVDMTTHAASDPICCPTMMVTRYYNLKGNQLIQYVNGWLVELADGTRCRRLFPAEAEQLQGDTTYTCNDDVWLRGDLIPGNTWSATRVSGWIQTDGRLLATAAKVSNLKTVWQ